VCTPPQPRGNDHGGAVQPPCQHGNHVSSTSFKATSAATFRTPAGENGARSRRGQHQRRRRTCWRRGVGRWRGRCSTVEACRRPRHQSPGLQLR
jgi:hypothetical protein